MADLGRCMIPIKRKVAGTMDGVHILVSHEENNNAIKEQATTF
jgi:hypothetical protein